MNILFLTLPVTFTLVLLFILLFVLSARSGQLDDLETPSHQPLSDDENPSVSVNGVEEDQRI